MKVRFQKYGEIPAFCCRRLAISITVVRALRIFHETRLSGIVNLSCYASISRGIFQRILGMLSTFFVYGLLLETGPPVLLWNRASSFIDENDHLSIKNCPTIGNLYVRECYPCEYMNNIRVKELMLSVIKGVIT